MAQIQIARVAETDLLEGYVFYEQQQAGVGDYFLDSLAVPGSIGRWPRAFLSLFITT